MTPSRRSLLRVAAAAPLAGCASLPAAPGPFRPTWESLIAGYRAPDWFRDAKFGIWAHWGPQCVPEFGDWYGRLMYVQGNPFYEHHVRTYGHPSRTGFLDIIGRWTAERWNPAALLDRFQAAGARYFMAMAGHHDNLDLYDSRHHPWNSVRVGPKRDIVGEWERLCRARSLPFAVSNHVSHAWHWWQTAYGYDAEGPMRGVRYDADRLSRADGAGTWWEGLDPQQLYTGPSYRPPDGLQTIAAMNAWHDARDGQWIETPPPHDPAFTAGWLTRQRDLVDRYRPDMVYFDNHGLPLGQAGLNATAEFYNATLTRTGALPVVNAKKLSPDQRRGVIETVERGFSNALRPEPWQTDTCLGDWHYNRARFEQKSYVPAKAVIQRLVDVVSKNGNLMLSVPMRGDGAIDSEEEKILDGIGGWLRVNGEAIYGTRPWTIYGEGPTEVSAGMQNEGGQRPWTAQDIRFTTKGDTLYVIPLDWPSEQTLAVRSLTPDRRRIDRIDRLGGGQLVFTQTAAGLTLSLPVRTGDLPPVLRAR